MANAITQLQVLSENSNKSISSTATKALKYLKARKTGAISESEYKDLIAGLQRTEIIVKSSKELQFKQMLSSALHGAVAIGSTLL